MRSHKKHIEPTLLRALATARLQNVGKKKAKGKAFTKRLSLEGNLSKKTPRAHDSSTPPLVAIKLIRLGKQKVKISANAVERTPSKQMRQVKSINKN